jgi:N-acetylglucosamine malate deacetylase 2
VKILYIFPHPDDESFGPAGLIHQQKKDGHEVHLLTLTRGEATKVKYQLGLSDQEISEKRTEDLTKVVNLLNLDTFKILDLPDGKLAHIHLHELENPIENHILSISPDILVTFPSHGISGHHDHIATHFAVKSIFIRLKGIRIPSLRRLAFITLPREEGGSDETRGGNYKVNRTMNKYIDAVITFTPEDRKVFLNSLACYEMFQPLFRESGVTELIGNKLFFELYLEKFDPPLTSLTERLQRH